ncbi:hypothetical protein C8A03DRAFT_12696 [Achaetomium macrosporum]|uniref:Uncharacterized protein n=1 Tax=Achaetomium macrosporum TaxID=79813 RepID=A0AAN7HHR9_9PEZI|nr:hypothetical protein C8A03DRAFT_12696 [Achaetomium macrosporum]
MFARAAARPTLQALARQAAPHQRTNFSLMQNLRSFARQFEPHPFQRLPMTSKPQPADYGRLVRRAGAQAMVYFPLGLTLLGWPYAARLMLDGNI